METCGFGHHTRNEASRYPGACPGTPPSGDCSREASLVVVIIAGDIPIDNRVAGKTWCRTVVRILNSSQCC